jgi:hypothetical protein
VGWKEGQTFSVYRCMTIDFVRPRAVQTRLDPDMLIRFKSQLLLLRSTSLPRVRSKTRESDVGLFVDLNVSRKSWRRTCQTDRFNLSSIFPLFLHLLLADEGDAFSDQSLDSTHHLHYG